MVLRRNRMGAGNRMFEDGKVYVGTSVKPEYLHLKLANRHGSFPTQGRRIEVTSVLAPVEKIPRRFRQHD